MAYTGTTTYRLPTATGVNTYAQRLQEAMKMLEGQGAQQRADLKQEYANLFGGRYQGLIDSGLTHGSAPVATRLGTQRQYQDALNRLNESLTNQKLGYYSQLTGEQAAAQQQSYWNAMNYAMQQQQLDLQRNRMQQSYRRPTTQTYMPAYAQGVRPSYGLNTSSVRAYRALNG